MSDDAPIQNPFANQPTVQEHKPEPVVYGSVSNSEPRERVPDGCLKPLGWIVGIALLLLAFTLGALIFGGGGGAEPNPPAPYEQEDRQAPDLNGKFLVFVLENTSPTVEQVEAFDDYDAAKIESLGMAGFRQYDEEQSEADPYKEFGLGRGLGTPAIFLTDGKEILDCAPFNNTQDVREFLGG